MNSKRFLDEKVQNLIQIITIFNNNKYNEMNRILSFLIVFLINFKLKGY